MLNIMHHKTTTLLMTAALAMAMFILTIDTSSAQSTRQRLTAIEKQLNALQRRVFTPGSRFQSGEEQSSSADAVTSAPLDMPVGGEGALMAEINIRISELETQIRQMTGQLEEANFKVNQLTRQIETMQKDNDFRFGELENGRGMVSGSAGGGMAAPMAGASTAPAASGTAGGTPKEKYDYAYGLVSNANYAEAEINFLEFLEQHPQDELAGNAQYWLGQTYYARGNYADATRTFLEGMSKYPESSKAPAYLLKVGMSLNLLGEKNDACEVFRELNARFPDSTENTRLRPTEERKAGCS
ncbi:tol-pal system protein YbgF [Pseudemcibacter aquimaris]|uniref:tol-pal system protein YbgF n=1 Tax=Pseudemcibacter aquimaris TaxID=2857064 RepID=UPI0020113BAD|nr:tol-pal system protein YbgF [Pseudemcibacter aquimaris]MCC3862189.1 tol-pal system protein YbgF [Pseudemcibacter aquimaris]WDU58942.1 tol-pal system protein YbgF [Pseudemcibacter aquimaris]